MDKLETLLSIPHPWIKQTTANRALILIYHRVTDLASDPLLLAVTPEHFREHLQVLHHSYSVMTVSDLAQHLAAKTLPPKSLAITFDDGYADNLSAAQQLAEFALPSTMFVTTEAVDSAHEFWWDELEQLLLTPGDLPQRLEIDQTNETFTLDDAASYSADTATQWSGWNVVETADPTPRHTIYRRMHKYLKSAPVKDREDTLSMLFAWAGRPRQVRPSHSTLSSEQMKELSQCEQVEIGSHTTTHPVLANLALDDQRHEIEKSRQTLQEMTGARVDCFAYPFGSRADFTTESADLVKECGYRAACSNRPDVVWAGTDQYRLPRLLVRDCGGESFAKWLDLWF